MMAASDALEFEKAIEYREFLNSVKKVAQKQKITDYSGEDRDIVALACERRGCGGTGILYPQWSGLIGRDHFYLRISEEDKKCRDSLQFYQAVLCRNAIYSGRTDASGGTRRAGDSWKHGLEKNVGIKFSSVSRRKVQKKSLLSLRRKNAKMVL